jgi:hypothetical protein
MRDDRPGGRATSRDETSGRDTVPKLRSTASPRHGAEKSFAAPLTDVARNWRMNAPP